MINVTNIGTFLIINQLTNICTVKHTRVCDWHSVFSMIDSNGNIIFSPYNTDIFDIRNDLHSWGDENILLALKSFKILLVLFVLHNDYTHCGEFACGHIIHQFFFPLPPNSPFLPVSGSFMYLINLLKLSLIQNNSQTNTPKIYIKY